VCGTGKDFLVENLMRAPMTLKDLCSTCAIAITPKPEPIRLLSESDFICTDFEVLADGKGAGPLRSGCRGNGPRKIANLAVDLAWVRDPSTATAPCCKNLTVMYASLYLLGTSAVLEDIGHPNASAVTHMPFHELQAAFNVHRATGSPALKRFSGVDIDPIQHFILRNIHSNGHFLQLLISRNQCAAASRAVCLWVAAAARLGTLHAAACCSHQRSVDRDSLAQASHGDELWRAVHRRRLQR
jgi:hypothetical protein